MKRPELPATPPPVPKPRPLASGGASSSNTGARIAVRLTVALLGTVSLALAGAISVWLIRISKNEIGLELTAADVRGQAEVDSEVVDQGTQDGVAVGQAVDEGVEVAETEPCAQLNEAAEREPPVEVRPQPFDHLLEIDRCLSLPSPPQSSDEVTPEFTELAKLYVDDLAQCDIRLVGHEVDRRDGREVITKKTGTDNVSVRWSVFAKYDGSLVAPMELGTFQLKDESLQFRWAALPSIQLQDCLLNVRVGPEMQVCSFKERIVQGALPLDFTEETHRRDLELTLNDNLRMDVALVGLDEIDISIEENDEQRIAGGLESNGLAVFHVSTPAEQGSAKLDIEIQFEMNDTNRGIRMQTFCFPHLLRPLSDDDEIAFDARKTPLTERGIASIFNRCSSMVREIEGRLAENRELQGRLSRVVKRSVELQVTQLTARAEREVRPLVSQLLRKQIAKTREDYQLSVERAARQADWLATAREKARDNMTWCTEMRELLTRLNDGRIHFRAYVVIEGVDLDLAQSTGWNQVTSELLDSNSEQQ